MANKNQLDESNIYLTKLHQSLSSKIVQVKNNL